MARNISNIGIVHSLNSLHTITKRYSSTSGLNQFSSVACGADEFFEWFRGFTDAEGCFFIVKTGNSFAFRFIIKLHIDDLSILNFIKDSLNGIGNVTIDQDSASFKITSLS